MASTYDVLDGAPESETTFDDSVDAASAYIDDDASEAADSESETLPCHLVASAP